jgi:hypothetical protein
VPTPEEPHVKTIHDLARDGLSKTGPMGSMGVPRNELPTWDDIQVLPAQFGFEEQLLTRVQAFHFKCG